MADRSPRLCEKTPQSRKKKKNKRSKRKSNAKASGTNKPVQSNCNSTIVKTYDNDNYRNDVCAVQTPCANQDMFNFADRTQRHSQHIQGKHNRHDVTNLDQTLTLSNRIPSRYLKYTEENSHERNSTAKKACNDAMFAKNRLPNHGFPSDSSEKAQQNVESLHIELEHLTQENQRLKSTLNDIQYNWSLNSTSDIEIIFKKRHVDEKYSYVLNELISKLLNGTISVEALSKFCSTEKYKEGEEPLEPTDECLFAVDCSAEPHQSDYVPVPMYDASFNEILESPGDSKNASKNESGGRGRNCFNCGENHHIADCPFRLDFRKIALAKKKARANFVPSVRYHVHGKNEKDFKPGVISDELRAALGIGKSQIPHYVYRMRVLDYPPGWLHEAAVESSGMILYDSEGKALKEDNGEDCEGGGSSQVRVQYDPDKLIDYPGFNVPLPPDMIDECNEFGFPSLQSHQLRCFVEQHMAKPNVRPSRKRKINVKSDGLTKQPRYEEDMELEISDFENGDSGDFVPPLPDSEPPPPPPPPPPADTLQDTSLSKFTEEFNDDDNSGSFLESSNDPFMGNSGTASLSLAELEDLKKKLVMELGINTDDNLSSEASQDTECNATSNSNELDDSESKAQQEDFFILEDECVGSSDNSHELSDVSDSNCTPSKSDDVAERTKSFERTTSQSKCMVLGAPSLSQHSPYSKLPDYEQFSKNVSSHIPFENLPNSVGTYQKLKGVLKTVKKKFRELMQ